MDNLRGVIEYIRNFFDNRLRFETRKRRAEDPIDNILSPKCRKLQSPMANDFDDDWFLKPTSSLKTNWKTTPRTRQIDTVVLDDDEEEHIPTQRRHREFQHYSQSKHLSKKITSTPLNNGLNSYANGTSDDDEIKFVGEIKSPKQKQAEASKKGLNYIKPFSGSFLGAHSSQFRSKTTGITKPRKGSSSMDYSIRLDDKMQYKNLLEAASNIGFNDSSIYQTPCGKLFNYDTSNRSSKIFEMLNKSKESSGNINNSKEKMSTKDTIIKVLDDFEQEPLIVNDSDSESDVVIVSPPSPKPDIKVDPVNSLKIIVDSSQQTKKDWLDDLVDRHKIFVESRQKEIDELRECSEKHGKINKDMRWELLTDKVNRSLSIRDTILPIEEKEEEVELPTLSKPQLNMVAKAFRGDPNEILAQKFNLNITRRDMQTLAGLNWLNDEVINFYMNLIIERGKDSKWPKTFAFNTFFYPKLLKDGPQSLRRWTKRIDIFQHDLICIPIHLGMHWCMAIINLRDKSIRYYDSMGANNNKCLQALRNYLLAEHLDKKGEQFAAGELVLENVKDIPQQMNGSDCGMFACTFAEFLSRNARINFSQEDMPYLRKKMIVEIMCGQLLIN